MVMEFWIDWLFFCAVFLFIMVMAITAGQRREDAQAQQEAQVTQQARKDEAA